MKASDISLKLLFESKLKLSIHELIEQLGEEKILELHSEQMLGDAIKVRLQIEAGEFVKEHLDETNYRIVTESFSEVQSSLIRRVLSICT